MSSDVAPPVEGTVRPVEAPERVAEEADLSVPVVEVPVVEDDGGVVLAFPIRAADGAGPAVDASAAGDAAGSSSFTLSAAPTGRRLRARMARFNAPWQTPQVSEVLEPLIATHRASHAKADTRLLQRAYDTAAQWHAGQFRKSGDPYIT
ncbi:MAG: GTP pyrophosphokinase, partial [Micromonosporaceae bacterium]